MRGWPHVSTAEVEALAIGSRRLHILSHFLNCRAARPLMASLVSGATGGGGGAWENYMYMYITFLVFLVLI